MPEFCEDEIKTEKKFMFGEEVVTDDGIGVVVEMDSSGRPYNVCLKSGGTKWYSADELQKYVN